MLGEEGSLKILSHGIQLRSTSRLRNLLVRGLQLKVLKEEAEELSEQYAGTADGDPIPFRLLQQVIGDLRQSEEIRHKEEGGGAWWLHEIAKGSDMILEKPPPRVKSAELEARLAKLAKAEEFREYNELVKDVTRHERSVNERERFATYKSQMGFGLHVLVTMFTCYVCGYTLFRSQFRDNTAIHVAGGVLGLIVGMLVETLLFIIQSSRDM